MTSSLRPTSTDADILPTPRTCLHAGWDDGSTPVPGYRWYPVHDTPLTSARGRCLVVVGRRLHALGLLWVHPVTRSNNRASTRWYSSPPVRWLRHTAPRCTPLSRHNERDTTQRTPPRTRGEGAGSTRRRNGACRAPNEWRSYRVWEPQGALHEHLCGISGPQSRAPPLPEYPHSTNPRTLTHVDGLNLDAPASPAPQESAPGCFSDCSWGINHNC